MKLEENNNYTFLIVSLNEAAETFSKKQNVPAGALNSPIAMYCHQITCKLLSPVDASNNLFVGQICTDKKKFVDFVPKDIVELKVRKISPKGSPTFEFVKMIEKADRTKNIPPAAEDAIDLEREKLNNMGRRNDAWSLPADWKEQLTKETAIRQRENHRERALAHAVTLYSMKQHTTEEVLNTAKAFETYLTGVNDGDNKE